MPDTRRVGPMKSGLVVNQFKQDRFTGTSIKKLNVILQISCQLTIFAVADLKLRDISSVGLEH